MDETIKKVCSDFEIDKWLLLEGSIPEEEKIFWKNHLSSCSHCSYELDSAKEIMLMYDNLPAESIHDSLFNKMINVTTGNANNDLQEVPRQSLMKTRSLSEIFGFYKLAFGGTVLAAALILIFITFFNNPKIPEIEKRIPKELLAWDFPRFSNQLTSIENQILSLETNEWNIYIVRKNSKEDWNSALKTIYRQIKRMKREALNSSM